MPNLIAVENNGYTPPPIRKSDMIQKHCIAAGIQITDIALGNQRNLRTLGHARSSGKPNCQEPLPDSYGYAENLHHPQRVIDFFICGVKCFINYCHQCGSMPNDTDTKLNMVMPLLLI